MLKGVSLFANIGFGELSLPSNFRVIAANDIDPKRCNLYKKLHPHTNVIVGDISKKTILNKLKEFDCDFVISTPPCQGMSNLGRMEKMDPRNHLVKYSIDFIKTKKPKFIFHENVPNQNKTLINYRGKEVTISEFICKQLSKDYFIEKTENNKTSLRINLKYYEGDPVIKEIKRISKPGRRVYSRATSIPKVMNGLGLAILSTPKGVMSDTDARKNNVGGEIICRVF